MSNLLDQGLNLGLSVVNLTAEKANELAASLISLHPSKEPQDVKQLASKLVDEGLKARQNLQDAVNRLIQEGKIILPRNKEVDDLKAKIAELEAELAALKSEKA